MKYLNCKMILIITWCFISSNLFSQDRVATIKKELTELSKTTPGLTETVELSVSGVSIQEFVRALASTHNLNVSIDPKINKSVANNFANANVADVLLFLCKQYELDIEFIGNIMSITAYIAPPEPPKVIPRKKLKIDYEEKTDFLSLDLKKDTLYQVAKEITKKSFKNVIIAPNLENKLISGFIQNRPFMDALDKLAFANDLSISKTDDNFYLIETKKKDEEQIDTKAVANSKNRGRKNQSKNNASNTTRQEGLEVTIDENERIKVDAVDVPITDIIYQISGDLIKSYFLFSEPKGNTSLYIENATYDEFLTYLLNGSDYTYKVENKVYLIGERKLERLRTTELVQLENRTVESIIDFIPSELKKDVDIQEFTELNSLVLSGSHPQIVEIKNFIRSIDRVVPVVLIEVMIVDYRKSHTLDAGISMGVGTEPGTNSTTILPNPEVSMNANMVNSLINSFNGFGFFNLGRVTPNFYMSIRALENNGVLNTRSTPKLATINGHEASLSIGNTEYYLEVQNNVIGTQNPQNVQSQQYKSVNADLSVTITPIVSGDEQVTLDINVEQSDFTARISPNAPPGSVTRTFSSLIRVKNEEMILLGGLESKSANSTGNGIPFLARIPVLKWIFGNQNRQDSKSKLSIFIKPTIIY